MISFAQSAHLMSKIAESGVYLCKRLRIHSSPAMDGRLFVQFIALILTSALRKKMRETKLADTKTLRELLMEMETLTHAVQ